MQTRAFSAGCPAAIAGLCLVLATARLLAGAATAPAPAARPNADLTSEEIAAARLLRMQRMASVFAPNAVNFMSLSPDGRYFAYDIDEPGAPRIVIRNLDDASFDVAVPLKVTNRLVGGAEDTSGVNPFGDEPAAAGEEGDGGAAAAAAPTATVLAPSTAAVVNTVIPRLTYLRWVLPNRLVYQVNNSVRAVDADGKNDRRLADEWDVATAIAGRGGVGGGLRARTPRVLGNIPGQSGKLLVTVQGNANETPAESFLVDAITGTRRSLGWSTGGPLYSYDLQGKARLQQTDPVVRTPDGPYPIPVAYGYREATGRGSFTGLFPQIGWKRLEAKGAPGENMAFDHKEKEYYQPRSIPLAFGTDPDVFYYGSNIGENTYSVFSLNLRTKAKTSIAAHPVLDLLSPEQSMTAGPLVFDRAGAPQGISVGAVGQRTYWLDSSLRAAQERFEAHFENRNVQILEWNDARTRYLVRVTSQSYPGAFHVIEDGAELKVLGSIRRTPEPPSWFNEASAFSFTSDKGVQLTGRITMPRKAQVATPPLVVVFHTIPGSVAPGFNPSGQALATLGYAVLELNYRGSTGFGTAHRDAARKDPDLPIEDVRAAIAWLKTVRDFDATRIATFGRGLGGYYAVRAAQLYPREFRTAVVLDGIGTLNQWVQAGDTFNLRRSFFGEAGLGKYSIVRDPPTKPILVLATEGGRAGATRMSLLATSLNRGGARAGFLYRSENVHPDDIWRADAEMFLRLGQYLDQTLYDFGSTIGEMRVVEDGKSAAPRGRAAAPAGRSTINPGRAGGIVPSGGRAAPPR